MKEFNVVIKNENLEKNKDLIPLIFGDEDIILIEGKDMFDILVMCNLFQSKGQARKNWTKTGKEIPQGFNDFEKLGKLNHRLTIFNPK